MARSAGVEQLEDMLLGGSTQVGRSVREGDTSTKRGDSPAAHQEPRARASRRGGNRRSRRNFPAADADRYFLTTTEETVPAHYTLLAALDAETGGVRVQHAPSGASASSPSPRREPLGSSHIVGGRRQRHEHPRRSITTGDDGRVLDVFRISHGEWPRSSVGPLGAHRREPGKGARRRSGRREADRAVAPPARRS